MRERKEEGGMGTGETEQRSALQKEQQALALLKPERRAHSFTRN